MMHATQNPVKIKATQDAGDEALQGTLPVPLLPTPTRQMSLSLHVVFPQYISCEDKAITEPSLCYLHVYDGLYGGDISAVSTASDPIWCSPGPTNGIFPIDKRICRTAPFSNPNKVILTAEIFYFHFSTCGQPFWFCPNKCCQVGSVDYVGSTYD